MPDKKDDKFRIKSWDEIRKEQKEGWENFQKDVRKNWQKFQDGINNFFGIPPNKKIDGNAYEPRITSGNEGEERKDASSYRPIPSDEGKSLEESLEAQNPEFEEITAPKKPSETDDSNLFEKWEKNWDKFAQNTMLAFDDMQTKINAWNQQNVETMQDQILNNEMAWKVWLKKQEISRKDQKEKRKLAIKRFEEWVQENSERVQRYFEDQRDEWAKQLDEWKKQQEELKKQNKEKWLESQRKLKEDYEDWIESRRDRAMEKAKYKLRVGWRQNLYIMMSLLPVIIVIILILALVNAFT